MCKPHLKHMRKRWMAGSEWGEHLQCSNPKPLSLSLSLSLPLPSVGPNAVPCHELVKVEYVSHFVRSSTKTAIKNQTQPASRDKLQCQAIVGDNTLHKVLSRICHLANVVLHFWHLLVYIRLYVSRLMCRHGDVMRCT